MYDFLNKETFGKKEDFQFGTKIIIQIGGRFYSFIEVIKYIQPLESNSLILSTKVLNNSIKGYYF